MTNAPEAEWHVVCEQCGQVMTPNSGCLPYIVFESGKRYKRERHFDDDGRPCHDCNAGPGKYHHTGCDSDYCPVCDQQILFHGANSAACDNGAVMRFEAAAKAKRKMGTS